MNPTTHQFSSIPLVVVRVEFLLSELSEGIPQSIGRVAGWIESTSHSIAGPPIVAYPRVDMANSITTEIGFPVESHHAIAKGEFLETETPAGRYLCLDHTGAPDTLVQANADLQRWAGSNNLKLDVRREHEVEYWAGRFEQILTGPNEESDQARWVTRIMYKVSDTQGTV